VVVQPITVAQAATAVQVGVETLEFQMAFHQLLEVMEQPILAAAVVAVQQVPLVRIIQAVATAVQELLLFVIQQHKKLRRK
jgi:hypothetical protein